MREEIERVQRELRDALADTPAHRPELSIGAWSSSRYSTEAASMWCWRILPISNCRRTAANWDGSTGMSSTTRSSELATYTSSSTSGGCQLLRSSHGLLAYITSNSWLKAEYGKPLRRYFSEGHAPLALLELGKDVFASAIVDTSVLLLREGNESGTFPAVDVDHLSDADFPPDGSLWGRVRPDGEAPWAILSPLEQSVMEKMQAKGTPLGKWDVRINRGVLTGYNKAFIIDQATRDTLVAEDPNSADILRPVLRGRDIQRYRAKWAGRWLLFVPWHFPLHGDSSIKGSSTKAEVAFNEQYPAVYNHLLAHRSGLSSRNTAETGVRYEWYALQRWAADYYHEFAKEKLFWIELVDNGRFAYDNSGIYGEVTTFVMTGKDLKYLCAVLNSSLVRWFLIQIAPTSGMGTLRWKKVYLHRMPIPKISAAEQRPFIMLVDSILAANATNPDADTSHLEWEIDRLVYDLYGLTEEEDTAIERSLGLTHATDEEEDVALVQAIKESLTTEQVSRKDILEDGT